MKVSFGKTGDVAATQPVPPPEPPPAAAAEVEVLPGAVDATPVAYTPTPAPSAPAGAVATRPTVPPPAQFSTAVDDDKIMLSDLRIPAVNIVQGVGDLVKKFDAGTIVYSQEIVLSERPDKNTGKQTPVRFVLIGFRPTRYAEKVGQDQQGRILNTLDDVSRVGGSTVYKECYEGSGEAAVQIRPWFQPLGSGLVLVEAPAGYPADKLETDFPMSVDEDGGKTHNFALAFWHWRGTQYNGVAKQLKTARMFGCMRGATGYKGRWLEATVAWKDWGNKKGSFNPTVRISEPTSAAVQELAKSALDALLNQG